MELTPLMLIEETYNYYGLKADLSAAIDFVSRNAPATPGAFYDWVMNN